MTNTSKNNTLVLAFARLISVFCILTSSHQISAHEYWLDPIDSSIQVGAKAIIDARNGQEFQGSAFPFDKNKYQSVIVSGQSTRLDYEGRLGDYPALHPKIDKPGLYTVSLETNQNELIYESWEQFNEFLNYHNLDGIAEQHLQRNLPKSDIKEHFFRSAKTLIQVNKTGELNLNNDQPIDTSNHAAFTPIDSTFELQLLNNPYSNNKDVRVKLLYQGKPLANRQIEMFWKGTPLIRLTSKTNNEGITTFKLLGAGNYLLNAVHVIKPNHTDAHWQSHWASFTFER